MRLAVTGGGSNMSHPFEDVSITNTAAKACVLMGYPWIAFAGHRGFPDRPAPAVHVAIRVNHWIYERVDPGPHQVLIPTRHRALFSIGAGDAYEGPLFTLTRLIVILPGTRSPEVLAVSLVANGPPGWRIPVGITAIYRVNRCCA